MTIENLKPGKILRGSIFPEPVQVIVTVPMGGAVKLVAKGLNTGKVYEPVLTPEKLARLETSPDTEPFDGDPQKFRLGIEAMRLQLAFEYDPYFALSIARVDPLPHQLEAVYDYFLRLPRIHCATEPSLNILYDPATLDWQAVSTIEHYRLRQDSIRHPVELHDDAPPYKTGETQ